MNQIQVKPQPAIIETSNNLLKWKNKALPFIEDSGSDVNILSSSFVKDNNIPITKIPIITLKNIVGKITDAKYKTNLTLNIDGLYINVEFLVIDTENKDAIIIGKDTLNVVRKNRGSLKSICDKFPKVFDNKPSQGYKDLMCAIELKENKIVQISQRRIPQAMEEGAKAAIKNMLENKIIEPTNSSWCNPIRPVMKENGEIRITVNMQFLNNLVEPNNYTVPHIQNIIEKTQGKKWFTIIDLKDGYYQILVDPKDKFKTAFRFNNQLYQFIRMPQGFKNSPAIFQQIMDKVLMEELDIACNVYLDDIVVYGRTEAEHDRNLERVVKKLEENNFKINVSKMQYKQNEVKLLGSIINGMTQRPIPEKQMKILSFQTPKTKKEL